MSDDAELLRRYATTRVESDFAELVRRHLNLVYTAALRQVNGDAHLAQDVTQIVFTDLARKAAHLAHYRVLAAWLFTSTRYTAAKLVRSERRRRIREREAQLMQQLTAGRASNLDWDRVRPVLDDVLAELREGDRQALLLRFFEGRDFAAVGAKLNVSDNTARMRVERALDKLRALLERRGVSSTSAMLAAALAEQSVMAAPAGLVVTVTSAAISGAGAAMGGGLFSTIVSLTKLQIGIASALVLAGGAGLVLLRPSSAAWRAEAAGQRKENAFTANVGADNFPRARLAADWSDYAAGTKRIDAIPIAGQVASQPGSPSLPADAADELDDRVNSESPEAWAGLVPRATSRARAIYPAKMKQGGIEGEVTVDFVVDATGQVRDAVAVKSSRPEFVAPALMAVSRWKFIPRQKDGRAVLSFMTVPIVFAHENQDGLPGMAMLRVDAASEGDLNSARRQIHSDPRRF